MEHNLQNHVWEIKKYNLFNNSPTASRTFTLDTESTTKHMLDYFVPEDETDDNVILKKIRELIKKLIDTENDKPFSQEEIESAIKKV